MNWVNNASRLNNDPSQKIILLSFFYKESRKDDRICPINEDRNDGAANRVLAFLENIECL